MEVPKAKRKHWVNHSLGRKEKNMDCMASTIKDTLIMVLEIALRCRDIDELVKTLREMITKA